MMAFLPPISAMTRLTWSWPCRRLRAACSLINSPTSSEPVKAISATSGWFDERRADLLADAGQEVHDARRQAGF